MEVECDRKSKEKFYGGKSTTSFHGKKIPKQGSCWVCLWKIVIYSVCPVKIITQRYFWKSVKEMKKTRDITETMQFFSDDNDDDSEENVLSNL